MIVESPVVENFQRNLIFPSITWLHKNEFKKICNHELYPSCKINDILNEKILIGKNLPYLTNDTKNVFIGYVNFESNDQLKIATNEKKVIIENDYHILSIADPDSFQWKETKKDLIPNYAFRSCLNYNLFEYFYIGRTLGDNKYVGNVCRSDGLLYVCDEFNEAKSFENYEILCLKPSPTSLKQQCCIFLRHFMYKAGFKVSSFENYLPKPLINYLNYPSYLSNGDCLLKNEKLVSENGLHELKLNDNFMLEYYSVSEEAPQSSVLYLFVEAIWVNKYFTVINRNDNAFVYFLYLLSLNDINDIKNVDKTLKLQLTDNGQLILHQNGVVFKKYFINEKCNRV